MTQNHIHDNGSELGLLQFPSIPEHRLFIIYLYHFFTLSLPTGTNIFGRDVEAGHWHTPAPVGGDGYMIHFTGVSQLCHNHQTPYKP